MTIKENEVYTFKLNSGEELVAKVTKWDSDQSGAFYLISEPVSIAPGPQGMGLVPSMFTADQKESVRLNINSIAIYAPTDEGVKSKYLEVTTGIVTPSKKIVLG